MFSSGTFASLDEAVQRFANNARTVNFRVPDLARFEYVPDLYLQRSDHYSRQEYWSFGVASGGDLALDSGARWFLAGLNEPVQGLADDAGAFFLGAADLASVVDVLVSEADVFDGGRQKALPVWKGFSTLAIGCCPHLGPSVLNCRTGCPNLR